MFNVSNKNGDCLQTGVININVMIYIEVLQYCPVMYMHATFEYHS